MLLAFRGIVNQIACEEECLTAYVSFTRNYGISISLLKGHSESKDPINQIVLNVLGRKRLEVGRKRTT